MTPASSDVASDRKTHDSSASDEPKRLSAVFDALGDATCRTMLRALRDRETAMTAQELSSDVDVSPATLYRKLDRLTAAGLIEERDELDEDGHRRSRYRPVVHRIEILLESRGAVKVTLHHPETEFLLADS